MTRPLAIGDRVRIIGPSIAGDDRHNGETFRINAISSTGNIPYNPYDGIYYPASDVWQWYPASSLELVGDEVTPSLNVTRHDYNRLISRIRALEKWQAEHDLAAQKPPTIHVSAYIDFEQHVNSLEEFARDQESFNRLHEHPCRDPYCAARRKPDVVEPKRKVGDWVEVDCPDHYQHEWVFRIVSTEGGCKDASGKLYWDQNYLRKLSDDEIARRLNA